MEYAPAILVKE